MIKKTCFKQAYKYWPTTKRLEKAFNQLNSESGEGIDFAAAPAGTSPIPAALLQYAAISGSVAYAHFLQAIGKAKRKLPAGEQERRMAAARHADKPPIDVVPRKAEEGVAA